MRTTLTIDPDVERLLEDEVHRTRRPLKQIVNDALRTALAPSARKRQPPYRVVPHHTSLRPGIDPDRLNALADELEDDAVLKVRAGRRSR